MPVTNTIPDIGVAGSSISGPVGISYAQFQLLASAKAKSFGVILVHAQDAEWKCMTDGRKWPEMPAGEAKCLQFNHVASKGLHPISVIPFDK